ncbi:type VI secretion system protein ImpK [Desulfonauticus submarinus]|uniref:Type VI secretion system protein ImpK n=1 Tax=Desulfonauticus submarinus TaxID=206665 RepID=A0A1G9ZT05_9BACT|nr:DotU family type IV/VI secretion system protein [Desulfonauticus submarinus]SDN24549.1 type VI secretion system protein ImpK [Desulfonauticus submarinus]
MSSNYRLVDCFMEIFSYTLYFLEQIQQGENIEFEKVREDYNLLLKDSAKMAAKAGFSNVKWKKGIFPVAAFVDEKILCSKWQNKTKWINFQLQRKLFNTTNAGEEFFRTLEQLSSKDKDVREVYSYCLALGFNGKYYSEEDKEKLQEIKADNLLQYFNEDEDMGLPDLLCPEAYPLEIQKRLKPSYFSRKSWVLFVIPLILLISVFVMSKWHLELTFKTLF